MRHLKEEFDKLTFKEFLMYALVFLLVIGGFALLFFGMFIPPEGEIHESVITCFGIIMVAVGSILGVDMHYKDNTARFKAEIKRYVADALAPGKEKSRGAEPEG